MYPEHNISLTVKDARYVKGKSNYSDVPGVKWNTLNVEFEGWNNENKNYTKFLAELKSLMKICDDDDVKIVYLDDDNDEIPIECDEELKEALHIAYFENRQKGQCINLVIKKSDKDDNKLEAVKNVVDEKQKQKKVCSDSNMMPTLTLLEQPTKNASAAEISKRILSDGGDMMMKYGYNNKSPQIPFSSTSAAGGCKQDKAKSCISCKEIKETIRGINKRIEELKYELLKVESNRNAFSECNEAPQWFKDSLDQFKAEVLIEVEYLLDERLGTSDATESKASGQSNGVNKAGSPTSLPFNPENKELMQKFEELIEKEKRLDQRLEKMESKKLKVWKKMINSRLTSLAENSSSPELAPSTGAVVTGVNTYRVAPGDDFSVDWKLKNCCPYRWTEKTEMRLIECTEGLKPLANIISCPELKPSDVGKITVYFHGPRDEGVYVTKWLLFHCGRQIGSVISAEITVDKPQKKLTLICENKVDKKNLTKTFAACSINGNEKESNIQAPKQSGLSFDPVDTIFAEDTDEDKSDEDAFVVVPMPPCFFPDAPEDAVDPVPMKIKRKSVRFEDDKADKTQGKVKKESVAKESVPNELDGAVGGIELPDEPYESIEGSVYMVDKAGKCFLINDADSADKTDAEKQENEACGAGNLSDPSMNNMSQQCLIRDKLKKCVYVDSNGHPFDLPPDKVEKIYPGDPEYNNTTYTVCDGVSVDANGILRPIPGPNFIQFYFGYSQPQTVPPTHPEFCPPLPYPTIPPPGPPPAPTATLFLPAHPPPPPPPPPQIYQPFLPPPPPPPAHPHIPAGHPPPFHIPSSFVQPNYFHHAQQHLADHFNNMAHFDYVHHHHHPVNLTVDKNDISQTFGPNLNEDKPKEEFKNDVTEENLIDLNVKPSSSSEKPVELASGTEGHASSSTPPVISRKHKIVRMKKMKTAEHDPSICEWKKIRDITIRDMISKKRGGSASPRKTALYPKLGSSVTQTDNVIDFSNAAAAGSSTATNNTTDLISGETPEDCTKQAAPVHILPEGLMNGAINVACSAFSTAVNAINSLRPRIEEMPTEEEKLHTGLAVLYEMGFTNTVKNARLLKKYNYSIEKTVENYCLQREE